MHDPAKSPFWPADNPAVKDQIDLLQAVISRLANNSSSRKTWCVSLFGALLGLAGVSHVASLAAFAIVPVVIFGFMDTMYLAQEKSYRDLTKRIVNAIRDGSYDRSHLFEVSAHLNPNHVFRAIASWSIWPVYPTLIFAYVAALYVGWGALIAAVPKTP
jgi:hypothetical protein